MACCISVVVFTCVIVTLVGLGSFTHAEEDLRTTRRYGRGGGKGGRRGGGFGNYYGYPGFGYGYGYGKPFDYREEIDGGSAEEAAYEGESVESEIPQKIAPNEVHATLADDSASSKQAVVDGNHAKSQTTDRLANSHNNNDAHLLAKEAAKKSEHAESKRSEQMVEAAENKAAATAEDGTRGFAKEAMEKGKQVESERPQQLADNEALPTSNDGHA
ncbi:hypothetical protein KP509_12G041900 [Ceratopteris richardii]|uniref:Uncharacterized protein n=1 Tax=Ceratopteris richardii TaxID=49495 RepID=A0A8T2TL01_CERRI|nr:hypothetical protein KP509_12G041800 [Ceratopteris richardii]KAH7423158.1 hypothetical protein KP509_12G041900 [Ceratopteris richardii]